jgi:DNA-binding CsgD family transcriptional regulator
MVHDPGALATGQPPVAFGMDLAALTRADWQHYGRELEPVQRAAQARRGVAVDSAVLPASHLHRCRFHREIVAPRRGRHSLLGYLRWRGEASGLVVLGRRDGAFSDRELEVMEDLLPALSVALAALVSPRPPELPDLGISPREREILDYLRLGFRNREIALALGTSANTVRNQLSVLFRKLGASTRAEAVALSLGVRP